MLVLTGRPLTAPKVCTLLACLPEPTSLIVSAGLPARRSWYACWMPVSPMGSPALYGAPRCFAAAAVAGPTTPVSSAIDPDCATAAGELSTVPSAPRIGARGGQVLVSVNFSPAFSIG